MKSVYKELLLRLNEGRSALVVSAYGKAGITRQLYEGTNLHPLACAGKGGALQFSENADGFILAERFSPKSRLIILGAGHIAVPLAAMGAMLHFEVSVFDDRPSFANRERFPGASVIICDYFENMARRLDIRAGDYVAIVTRGHKYDQECLRALLKGEAPAYLGMIGSRRRVNIVRKQLREEGAAPDGLERLHAPIGLNIGAVTPEEIALSILAEMVQERRGPAPAREGGELTSAGVPHLSTPAPAREGGERDGRDGQGESLFADMELLRWLAGDRAEKSVLITVLSVQGSAPRGAGAKMALLEDGRIIGSIGGGCAEAEVLRDARRILGEGGYCRRTVDMTDSAEEDGMVCGGVMEVLIEAADL
ncbi:MAG: XdhC family protein [Desulfovibrio sp.]|jgi:xanthine dehydrogenase accessory factor|nr:XdhC family protein [Desulfovibrio sp.]